MSYYGKIKKRLTDWVADPDHPERADRLWDTYGSTTTNKLCDLQVTISEACDGKAYVPDIVERVARSLGATDAEIAEIIKHD